jgi:hypothetical protein
VLLLTGYVNSNKLLPFLKMKIIITLTMPLLYILCSLKPALRWFTGEGFKKWHCKGGEE